MSALTTIDEVHASPSLWLPLEIWRKILLESVVETALMSDSASSLDASITNHAAVCLAWSSILEDPNFKRKAKDLLCAIEPLRRYRSIRPVIRTRGVQDIAGVNMLAMMGTELFASRRPDQIECYDSESYNSERRSLIFHHVRTITVFGDFRLEQPELMVGCRAARRLFVLDNNDGPDCTVARIDPDSGRIELAWSMANDDVTALTFDINDQLLVTMRYRLELYDIDGHFIRVVPLSELEPDDACYFRAYRMYGQTYAVCVEEDDDTVNELTIFDSDTGAITLFDPPVWVHGCTVDSRGCILMLEKQESCTRLVVMHYDPTRDFAKARYLLGIRYRPDPPHYIWNWKDTWLDEDRGILFAWTPGDKLFAFHVYDDS